MKKFNTGGTADSADKGANVGGTLGSSMMAKGGMIVTSIKDIPNFKKRLDEGKITYRGLGMGKLSDDFYDLAGETGSRIKVDGKEYFITNTEFDKFNRGKDGLMRIRFAAPYRKGYSKGGGTKENAIFREITTEELDKVRNKVDGFLNPLGYSAKVQKSIGDVLYIIEPSTRKVGTHRSDFFDGMQIIALHDGTFEVSEYMAGKNEDELHIYKETKSLTSALKDLIKGNKRKPIQKWNKGGQININDLDLPVIRSQFEDEEYEYKKGGSTSGFKYTIGGL